MFHEKYQEGYEAALEKLGFLNKVRQGAGKLRTFFKNRAANARAERMKLGRENQMRYHNQQTYLAKHDGSTMSRR